MARTLIASVFGAILWTVILAMLPFIEDAIWPPEDTNDSWQRGYIALPIVPIVTIPIMYFVGSHTLKKGYKMLIGFTTYSSAIGGALAVACGILLSATISYSERSFDPVTLLLPIYLGTVVFISLLLPAMLWWLLGKEHS